MITLVITWGEVIAMTHTAFAPQIDPLVAAKAAAELAQHRKLRAVFEAAEQGRTQREIAAILGVSQAAVNKMLVKAKHTRNLTTLTPREIALQYAAGEITREDLLETLTRFPHTQTRVLDPDNPLPEQIVPGTWGEPEMAALDGLISDEDLDIITARMAG